ncbi:hypothetical protein HMPREF0495_01666 [Levilactobacillus brevis ATCC 14869 = DSM 20054]|uniref:Uncharacterized protein n=1 Tax=Levilactobacillus brevis ATCC 14869 = DSM 20054 TaxID=649758 RepID=U2NYG1_LEVBR|nr:hypothetical protein HMPREF0495_01666 [Levilactobacillus brevis ATCC 14869 = DSM 20054]
MLVDDAFLNTTVATKLVANNSLPRLTFLNCSRLHSTIITY